MKASGNLFDLWNQHVINRRPTFFKEKRILKVGPVITCILSVIYPSGGNLLREDKSRREEQKMTDGPLG